MSVETPMELELKYVAEDERPWALLQTELLALMARLGYHAEAFPGETQVDTYFDTPERTLDQREISLRIRQKGTSLVLTCKGPAGAPRGSSAAFSRWEEEAPAQPGGLCAPENLAFIKGALAQLPQVWDRLAPVLEVENFRRTYRLTEFSGGAYELALDRVTYRSPTTGVTSDERQVELEWNGGGNAGLPKLERAIAVHLPGLRVADGSKFRRGLAQTETEKRRNYDELRDTAPADL